MVKFSKKNVQPLSPFDPQKYHPNSGGCDFFHRYAELPLARSMLPLMGRGPCHAGVAHFPGFPRFLDVQHVLGMSAQSETEITTKIYHNQIVQESKFCWLLKSIKGNTSHWLSFNRQRLCRMLNRLMLPSYLPWLRSNSSESIRSWCTLRSQVQKKQIDSSFQDYFSMCRIQFGVACWIPKSVSYIPPILMPNQTWLDSAPNRPTWPEWHNVVGGVSQCLCSTAAWIHGCHKKMFSVTQSDQKNTQTNTTQHKPPPPPPSSSSSSSSHFFINFINVAITHHQCYLHQHHADA